MSTRNSIFAVVAMAALAWAGTAGAVELKPYGFIKADLSVDMGNPHGGGNWVSWVDTKPEETPTTMNIHARQSRLGFDLVGKKVKDVEVMGRIETDFTNGGKEYTYLLKLRKAYLKVATPTMELLAGQESDIISPLVPSTVNYLVAWWAGNIGFRRPQIRFTYKMDMGDKSGLDVTVGVTRGFSTTIGNVNYDVATPAFAGRIGYRSPSLSLGISGHYGQERERFDGAAEQYDAVDDVFDSYSANFDLKLKLTDSLCFKGEAWWGANLDTYLGAVGQGVAAPYVGNDGKVVEAKSITAMGGWGQIGYRADRLKVNLGGSMDMPTEDDVNYGGRSRNMSVFGNVWYMMAVDTWVAVEGAYWKTDYKEPEGADDMDSDDIRGQLAFVYYFK